MSDDKKKTTLFHHTSREGALAIAKSGKIKQSAKTSTTDDATYGDGAYFNKMGPDHSRADVAKNNYDGKSAKYWEGMMDQGKADAVIEVKVPTKDVESHTSSGRDIHKTKGDFNLPKSAKVHIRDPEDDTKYKTYQLKSLK